MPTRSKSQKQDDEVMIPFNITWRDIVSIVGIAITLTTAWGLFGTRITILEKEVVSQDKTIQDMKSENEKINQKVNVLENRVRDAEASLEDVWRASRNRDKQN